MENAYRTFIRRTAAELLATPDSLMSLLCGSAFRALRPELYAAVRRGQREFGLPPEQLYDDLVAACAARRRSLAARLHFCFLRGGKCLILWLRLLWILQVVFRFTARKMRGPAIIEPCAANEPCRGDLGSKSGHRGPDLRRTRIIACAGINKMPPAACSREAAGSESAPQAAIVIVSFNRLAYLQTTIAALRETAGPAPYELIVVDNGSRDGSVDFLRESHRQGLLSKLVLLQENQGISAGYNHGFAAADERARYVMKLDSDIKILSHGWLDEAMAFLDAHPTVGFVALNQVNHPMLRLLKSQWLGGREVMDFADWTVGSAMLIPLRVKRELGCFVEDPQMLYAPDDIDFYVRASRLGYRAYFLRKLLAYHQSDLDRRDYRQYSRAKPARESSRLAIRLAGQYDRGTRPLTVYYEKYR